VTIPALTNDKHFARLDLVFDKFEGKNTEGSFTLQAGGQFEQRLRSLWQYSRERDKTFREMVGHIYSNAEVTQLTANNADSLWQSFNLTGQYKFNNVWNGKTEPLTYGFNITQLINLFTDFRGIDKPKDRVQEYEIDPGFTISGHIVFGRPTPDHIVNVTSQGQNFENNYFSLEQKGREENGNYIVDIKLAIKATRITVEDYPRYHAHINQLLNSNEWTLVYRYDKNTAEMTALTEAALSSGKAENFIALAKLQIKNGNYAKALDSAKEAVKSEPGNATAYYMLGLAQGYNNLLYESEKSFAKAEELGFAL